MYRRFIVVLVVGIVLSLSSYAVLAAPATKPHTKEVETTLFDGDGNSVGEILFTHTESDNLIVAVSITDLPRGYYTLAAYEGEECERSGDQAFASLGEPLPVVDSSIADPFGGLLPIYVMLNGQASITYTTDRLHLGMMLGTNGDGSVVVVQAMPEPSGTGTTTSAQQTALTSTTGAEGARVACGVIKAE